MPRSIARRRQGYAHDVDVDGHSLVVDEPQSSGGTNLGPTPTRLVAAALASCTAITIEMYAERKGWDVGELEVCVDMEYGRASQPASFIVTVTLPSRLPPGQRDRLIEIAGKCPVHRMLAHDSEVEVEDRVEVA